MVDTQVTPWDEIDVDESVSEIEQEASNDISMSVPVGKFLCTVVECNAVEKNFDKYTCVAAATKFQINEVIEIETVVLDKNQKPLIRDGEVVKKVIPVIAVDIEKINTLNAGKFIKDDITLHHVSEKPGTKSRRVFIAKKIGIITRAATEIKTKDWANSIGKKVIVITDWNQWKDKNTDEVRKNVRVKWDGYETAPAPTDDIPFADGDSGSTPKTEQFEI